MNTNKPITVPFSTGILNRAGLFLITMLFLFSTACKKNDNREMRTDAPGAALTAETEMAGAITVYYFHTTYRCYSCNRIEDLTRETLKKYFTREMSSEKIIFKSLNIEKPENKHYMDQFQLFTKTVVLVDRAEGKKVRWKRLDKTWNYLKDKDAFQRYIKDELSTFISEAG